MNQIKNTNLVLNEIVLKGDKKSINSIISKLKISELTNSNIKNLFPIPRDIQEIENLGVIDIATKINLYKNYNVYSHQEWIERYWGTDDFNNIEKIEFTENELKFSFYSEYSDSKLILLHIQRNNPKLKTHSVFTFYSNHSIVQFDSLFIDGGVYYSINNSEKVKFENHIDLLIREIDANNNFESMSIAA